MSPTNCCSNVLSDGRSTRDARFHRMALVIVLAALPLCIACNGSPTSPSQTPTPPAAPSPPGAPSPPSIARLEIVAPPFVEPGVSIQLQSNAVSWDGSVVDVTSETEWTSTDSTVLQISSDGRVRGGNRGEGVITASYRSANRSVTLMVAVLFPSVSRAARIYNGVDASPWANGSRLFSRYVLYDDSTFALQSSDGGSVFFEYRGTYLEANGHVAFDFAAYELNDPADATGTITDRGLLSVRYVEYLQLSDFVDGLYLRAG